MYMSGRREEIVNLAIKRLILRTSAKEVVEGAMDEYMKECCLSLLQYMADNNIKLSFASTSQEPLFMCGGLILTKEEVFENFL